MIKVLIVDDEPLARENLVLRISTFADFEICGQADNGHDAVLLASKLLPDVIFLDINMPGVDGLEAAKLLMENQDAIIIFITAYSEHAIEAFRVEALDYIVKPIDDRVFKKSIERVRGRVGEKTHLKKLQVPKNTYLKRLGIKDNSAIYMLAVSQIDFIEAAGDYLCITAGDKNYIHKQTLKSLLTLIDPEKFIQIHRSSVLNIASLDRVENRDGKMTAILKNGKNLNVSRRYKKAVKEKIEHLRLFHR